MPPIDIPNFYRPFDKNDFHYDRCFLCGSDLAADLTREHVFPKWLLHQFNLFNEELTLFNGSRLPYRYLTIPCCKTCNGIRLSNMEQAFLRLWEQGFTNLTAKDEMIIFQWTAKLLYGTLYKELSLKVDRRDPQKGTIMTPELVNSYGTLHLFLQSIRIDTEFRQPVPWSVFAFRYSDESFDYTNDIRHMCVSIKLGRFGVTIAFEDNQYVARTMERLKGLYRFELKNYMFTEVSARIFYAARLLTHTPLYVTAYHEPTNTMTVSSRYLPAREFDPREFAELFGAMLKTAGQELDQPIYQDGRISTMLFDEEHGEYLAVIKKDEIV